MASSPQLGAKDGVEQLIDCPRKRAAVKRAADAALQRSEARRAHVRNIESLFPGWNENGSRFSRHMALSRAALASREGTKPAE